jgi:hypothetical protein
MVRHVIAVSRARSQCGALRRRACIGAIANIHRRRIRTSTSPRIRARWHTLAHADNLVQIAAQGHAPDPQLFTGSWQNVRRDHAEG